MPSEQARARRAEVARALTAARREEREAREERAAALLDEINTLNRERLALLGSLSPAKRAAITGFTVPGLDQARSEMRQLSLVLRYHQHAALAWLRQVRSHGAGSFSAFGTVSIVLPLVVAILAFFWMRRRSKAALSWADARLLAEDRAERRTTPSAARRAVRMLQRAHRPLEWILFCVVVQWLLPDGAQNLLEVQLVASILRWTLLGALEVNTLNAFAAGATKGGLDDGPAGRLRLRSLQLVGRTVVVFGLILVLSARLVGEGTIYRWVFSTCWFAAIPIFLIVVRWWREVVFERIDRVRKKTPLQAWILHNRSGWKSFGAAMVGAVQLFVTGAFKIVRTWLSSFDVARRAHAYLFRREIERLGSNHTQHDLAPLPVPVRDQLHPEQSHGMWLPCPADAIRASLRSRIADQRGGLIALIAARGMGKTSLGRELVRADAPDLSFVQCDSSTTAATIDVREAAQVVFVDDAHALVEPRIGGLARFDEVTRLARQSRSLWLFAIDAAVWPMLKRARDARPMFDDVHVLDAWSERQIGALLSERCARAAIEPTFDDLLDSLPPGADEVDRQDALRAKSAGYERMLWDHVGGNPGLALEAWRTSLAVDSSGVVHGRPLQVPDITRLERLPDASLFVLRAVLQLAPTNVDAVAQATRFRVDEILEDIRFGLMQGYYDQQASGVRISWPWLRAVTRLLERRHLLVTP